MSGPTYCVCGAEMEMVHASVMNGSDLGCCWLKCNACGRQSTPAILESEAKQYWEYFKKNCRGDER